MMKNVHRHPSSRPASGFSLIEIVGVLAIMSILFSMAGPSLIAKFSSARISAEKKELPIMGDALQRHILRTKTVPNEDDWARVIADELGFPLEKVTTSYGRKPRVYLIDPALRIGAGGLPYAQTERGSSTAPVSARVMIVSSQGAYLPNFLASGVAASADIFNGIWDVSRDLVPAGWPAEWAGKGEDLQIHRINLTPLFHQLVVNNVTGTADPGISIDGGAPFAVPAGGLDGYYLDGTVIGLYRNTWLESQHTLTDDRSYVNERGVWRGQLAEGKGKDPTDLARALDGFLSAGPGKGASQRANRLAMIDAYQNYVLSYATWARSGFPAYDSANLPTPEYQALVNARERLGVVSGNLILK